MQSNPEEFEEDAGDLQADIDSGPNPHEPDESPVAAGAGGHGEGHGGGGNPFYVNGPVGRRKGSGKKKTRLGLGRKASRFHEEERRMLFVRRGGRHCAVSSEISDQLRDEIRSGRVVKGIDTDGDHLLVVILDSNDPWSRSTDEVVELGHTAWVRSEPCRDTCTHVIQVADGVDLPEPEWANTPSIDELIREVFAGRMIDSITHRLFKK